MAKVIFKQGNKTNLPIAGVDNQTLYFTNDTGELYKSIGNGLPLKKISDVIIADILPVTGIEGKIYVIKDSDNISIYIWDGVDWKTLVSGGVADDRVDILFNLKNKTDILLYDSEGNIKEIHTSGDVTENIEYEYNANGDISKEIIYRQNKKITNTFSYNSATGLINKIETVVVDI